MSKRLSLTYTDIQNLWNMVYQIRYIIEEKISYSLFVICHSLCLCIQFSLTSL